MNYPFNSLSSDSKIWVFLASRNLTADETNTILKEASVFLETWTAHNKDLKSGVELLHHQFLVIAVDENHESASGCSIDKLFQFIKTTEKSLHVSLLDRLRVAYRAENEINNCSISEIESKINSGEINAETIVFNTLGESMKDLNSKFEIRLAESWLSRYLKKEKHEN